MQILLWTFVIGGSVVYVVCLTGNLINMTDGVLQLMGIATAALLGASVSPAPAQISSGSQTMVATLPSNPSWSDLVNRIDGGVGIDVARVQMLFFTVVTAGFVGLKVLSVCVIPEIPSGYLLLMGISNGTYLAARFIPTKG